MEQSGILKEENDYITIKTLPAGLYLLELYNSKGEKSVRKFIKN